MESAAYKGAPTGADDYTGVDNLEVMKEAVNYNRYLASLIDAQVKPGARVMDFGAGAGTFALPLHARGVDILCLEPDTHLSAYLRQAGASVVTDVQNVPGESVDFIYTLNVLEHIEDDGAAARALAAKLKPGGRLLVYCPAFQILYSAMDRKVGHCRRYRREGLVSLLQKAGLRIEESYYTDSLGFAASLLYRFIGNDSGDINRAALKTYDRVIFPLSRLLDRVLSRWVGKNVVVVAAKSK